MTAGCVTSTEILEKIKLIEKRDNIEALFSCEAGSRAWGYGSPISDHDVRVVYIKPLQEYLRVETVDDFIPDHSFACSFGKIDMAGWDLRKALYLLRKSNVNLLEWVFSPVCYQETTGIVDQLKEFSKQYIYPKSVVFHCTAVSERVVKDHLKMPRVKVSSYFKAIRPLLQAQVLLSSLQFEVDVNKLLVLAVLPTQVRARISALKDAVSSLDTELVDWIDAEIRRLRSIADMQPPKVIPPSDHLDKFFCDMVIMHDRSRILGQSSF